MDTLITATGGDGSSSSMGIGDVVTQIARDPEVRGAVSDALQSIGHAISNSWRKNDGTRAVIAAVQAAVTQPRR